MRPFIDTKNQKRRNIMSRDLPYQDIVSQLRAFVLLCGIMARGKNASHSITYMVDAMAGASVGRSSVGGYAAAQRAESDRYDMPGDEWTRKALARADVGMVSAAFYNIVSGQLRALKKMC